MTLSRRSPWDVSADPANSFDATDDMHTLTATSRQSDPLPPNLQAALDQSAANARREQQEAEARRLRARRISDEPREDAWERVREVRCG